MNKLTILAYGLICSSLVSCSNPVKDDEKQPAVREGNPATKTVRPVAEVSALGDDGRLQSTTLVDSSGRGIKSYQDENGNTIYVDAEGRRVYVAEDGSLMYGDPAYGQGSVTYTDGQGNALNTKTIYFDFDKSNVKADFQNVIAAHANYLSANPDLKITLEGHTDERGSREYNIALGERRGKSVEQMLLLQGVAPQQLNVISFGEERPINFSHDESAWSLNRRVELIYPEGF